MDRILRRKEMKVKLDEGAKMPLRAHETDAGYDLFAREDFEVPAGEGRAMTFGGVCYISSDVKVGSATHDTGVHIEIPKGYVGFIKSKSGLNVKHGLTAEGVIDSGYTGSIVVKLYNHTREEYRFKKGDKITQLVILPIYTPDLELVMDLDATERGDGGFGSTGK